MCVCARARVGVLSFSLSSLDRYLRVCFGGSFFFWADLQVLWLCGARVCVGGQVLVYSHTFVFECVSVCVCLYLLDCSGNL